MERGERRDGFFALSQISALYQFLQDLLAGDKARRLLLEDHLRPADGMRILDVGCGSASLLPYLGAVDYTGLDPNPDHIRNAKQRFATLGRKGQTARFHCAGADQIRDLAEGHFDLAMSIGVLHHLRDSEAEDLCKSAAALLAPGGRFVTVDPAFVAGQHIIAKWLAACDAGQAVRSPQGYSEFFADFAHVRTTVRHDLLRLPYTHCIIEAQ